MPTERLQIAVNVWNARAMKYDVKHSEEYSADRFQLSWFSKTQPMFGEVLVRVVRGKVDCVTSGANYATVFLSGNARFEVLTPSVSTQPVADTAVTA